MSGPRCPDCGVVDWSHGFEDLDRNGRCPNCNQFPTLGHDVGTLIQERCAIPDGDLQGQPFMLTNEMWRFLLRFYRIDPFTTLDNSLGVWKLPFVYFRGGQLVRPQKWGKGPFSASLVCAECDPEGPVRFDGWDADGMPVGKPWVTPWWQITAYSADQTDNVWSSLVPMIELGALSADIPDTGKTRINLPRGGKIEPVTSAAGSRLGQKITGAVQDESHSWTELNGGRKLADTQRRNLAGMGGRWFETTNKWDPAEESVAQQTSEAPGDGVYLDDVDPGEGSIRNKAERRRMLKKVYGDSWWVDLDRIDGDIVALLDRDPAQAERFYLNRERAAEASAFNLEQFKRLALDQKEPDEGSVVVVGVDGARFVDALAMVATHPASGFQWPVGIWERPESADEDYEHPFDEIDGAMVDLFARFDVWRVEIDPQYIGHLVTKWQGRWGDRRVREWFTNRPRQAAWMIRNYTDAMGKRADDGSVVADLSHSGDADLTRHIGNARKQKVNVYDDDHRQMYTLSKDRPNSPRKIDGAMAAALSWEARGDCIAAGATERRRKRSFVVR